MASESQDSGRLTGGAVRDVVRRSVRLCIRAGENFASHDCHHLAASMAYRTLFAIVPLLLLVVSVFGLVLQDESLRDELVVEVSNLVPITDEGQSDLEQILSEVATPLSAIGLLSLFGLLWGASGMMGALRAGLNSAWNVEKGRSVLHGKLFDFLLIFVAGTAILAAFGLSITVHILARTDEDLSRYLSGIGPLDSPVSWALGVIVPFLVMLLALTLLYRFVPNVQLTLRDVLPGSLLAAAGVALLKNGYSIYLSHFSNFNAIYGALGALFGFLLFVYLSAVVVLYGAEFAAEIRRIGLRNLFRTQRNAALSSDPA